VDPARVKKWKETVTHGVTHGRTPAGVACKECSGRKQRCFLPELSKERAAMKPSSKRRREEEKAREDREDGPRASGSGTKAGAAVGGGDEAPRKKWRVKVVIPPRPKKDAP